MISQAKKFEEVHPMEIKASVHLKGIMAAPGLTQGVALVWRKETLKTPCYQAEDPSKERERLVIARAQAGKEIALLRSRVEAEVGDAEAAVFDAHAMFLDDDALLEMTGSAITAGQNAEAAWMDAIEHFAHELEQIPDQTLSERAVDVRDVGNRVLAHLLGVSSGTVPDLTKPVVLVARNLEPSETASLNKKMLLAFCTAEGGATAHTAILAKAMGIPAVVGLGEKVLALETGCLLLVNGTSGEVIAFPDQTETAEFERQRKAAEKTANVELASADQPAITLDGKHKEVVANIGSSADAKKALEMGAEGVGLLRTEFLYLERSTAPSEEEQLVAYDAVLDTMGTRPVVVRTLDVGGDKKLAYMDLGKEDNPFLGWRAIRLCLDRPDFFKVQLRALLRSSPGHDVRIMFPMIATLSEVRAARKLLEEARRELQERGQAFAENVQVGIMVEIPSVSMMAEQFAKEVDFFSVGTNDLTQYTFAAERTNDKVAYLGDAIHPAVLRQIRTVIQAAHSCGIWVGVCGELAGDPLAVPLLLGLGLDEFSMAPSGIPRAKAVIRKWSTGCAASLAEKALQLESAQAVREYVQSVTPE
jgi:phosphoenolpyruvate-protein phosphotransferase